MLLDPLEPRLHLSVTYTLSHGELYARGTDARETLTVVQSNGSLIAYDSAGVHAFKATALLVNLGGGRDGITIHSSVRLPVTVTATDDIVDSVTNLAPLGWTLADPSDITRGNVVRVSAFYGGVSKAFGVASPELKDSGAVFTPDKPLWGRGPVATDVRQGRLADCWLLADMQAIAQEQPQQLRQKAFDMADGTYAVKIGDGWVRVSSAFSWQSAKTDVNLWAALIEKAYATTKGSYAAMNYGWNAWGFAALGYSQTQFAGTDASATARIFQAISAGRPVTIATMPAVVAPLLPSHAYSVISLQDGWLTLRNPWGFDGAGGDSDPQDGVIRVRWDGVAKYVRSAFIG